MDGFTYYNIFETKGIEYIAILAFFAVLIPFWILMSRRSKHRAAVKPGVLAASGLRVPQGLFFSNQHVWAHLGKSGKARIGIDDLLSRVTGDVSVQFLARQGDPVRRGDPLARLSLSGKSIVIHSPVSGIVLDHNELLRDDPWVVNEDPFENGWICQVKPTDWINETRHFHLAGEATGWMNRETVRFRDFLITAVNRRSPETAGVILQDGGELRDQTLAELPEEIWTEFQEKFLKQDA